MPILKQQEIERPRPLYWHFLRASSEPKVAMRVGDWKILARLDTPSLKPSADISVEEMQALKTAALEQFELYNLKDDPGESRDLTAEAPEKLEQLVEQLRVVYAGVQAESPVWPAWESPRYEAQRIEWPSYRKRPATRAKSR